MALIIKAKGDKKISLAGTTIELTEVYARLEWGSRIDGKEMEISTIIFTTKEAYKLGIPVGCSIQKPNQTITLNGGLSQDINNAHDAVKTIYEQDGYEVEIVDISVNA